MRGPRLVLAVPPGGLAGAVRTAHCSANIASSNASVRARSLLRDPVPPRAQQQGAWGKTCGLATRGTPFRTLSVPQEQRCSNRLAPDYVRAAQAALSPGLYRVRRPADAQARRATDEARLDRHDDGRRGRVLAPGFLVLALHGLVQPHRAARPYAPLGQSNSGCPLAVQFVARYDDEATLFRLGAQLEAARPWIDRRPAVSVA